MSSFVGEKLDLVPELHSLLRKHPNVELGKLANEMSNSLGEQVSKVVERNYNVSSFKDWLKNQADVVLTPKNKSFLVSHRIPVTFFYFLNFLFKLCAIFLFLGEIIIFLYEIFDLHIPVITEDAILPVPMKPKFIFDIITACKKKAPILMGALNF